MPIDLGNLLITHALQEKSRKAAEEAQGRNIAAQALMQAVSMNQQQEQFKSQKLDNERKAYEQEVMLQGQIGERLGKEPIQFPDPRLQHVYELGRGKGGMENFRQTERIESAVAGPREAARLKAEMLPEQEESRKRLEMFKTKEYSKRREMDIASRKRGVEAGVFKDPKLSSMSDMGQKLYRNAVAEITRFQAAKNSAEMAANSMDPVVARKGVQDAQRYAAELNKRLTLFNQVFGKMGLSPPEFGQSETLPISPADQEKSDIVKALEEYYRSKQQ